MFTRSSLPVPLVLIRCASMRVIMLCEEVDRGWRPHRARPQRGGLGGDADGSRLWRLAQAWGQTESSPPTLALALAR